MKKLLVPIAALSAATLCSSLAIAANKAETFVLTPFLGGYHFDGTQKIEQNLVYGLKAGYNITNRFGLEGVVEGGKTESSIDENNDVDFMNYRLEALYHMFPENRLVPYLAVGYGGMRVKDDYKTSNGGVFDYGVGAKYFLTDNVALRGDVRQLVIDRGPTVYNHEYTLGLGFIFGGAQPVPKAAEPAPAPAPAPPAPTSTLSVSPETVTKGQAATLSWSSQNTTSCTIQPGIGTVNTSGSMTVSPAETSNYSLSCAGQGGSTSSAAKVTVTQPAPPPVLDADKDGVPDDLDKCPNTPAGVKVDKDGCPLDADKDGVADYLDKCPDTPVGVKVDKDGCPLDSDRDGVLDYLDKCPDTPAGDKVDAKGCTIPVELPCQDIKLDIEFDTNKADVKPAYHDELKKVGDTLKKYPGATAVIEGHTDSVGSDKANLKLSERRANSVRTYIIDKFGIEPGRLSAKGYGESKPIATNDTAKGRKINRRVVAVLSCGN